MSKKVKGCYGSFNAKILDGAVKNYCRKKDLQLKVFFSKSYKLYEYNWYRSIRVNQYADKEELERLCKIINLDFSALEFREGHKKSEKLLINPKNDEFVQMSMDLSPVNVPAPKEDDYGDIIRFRDLVISGAVKKVTFEWNGINCTFEK